MINMGTLIVRVRLKNPAITFAPVKNTVMEESVFVGFIYLMKCTITLNNFLYLTVDYYT